MAIANANKHPSSMRIAVISASRAQRESLKTLIEENGPKVVGSTNFQEYSPRSDSLRPDVLLVDLEYASDHELERISEIVSDSKIPVLFNESPNIPTAPGPYRDDWANNLIGKLFDLSTYGPKMVRRGILNRPRYIQSTMFRFPKVLVLSRSKTRRRVLELILINQGFHDTHEAAFDKKYASTRPGAIDVILADEHNVGNDDRPALAAITAQSTVPVCLCNSSQIPTASAERKLWGQRLAGQIIQLHKKNKPTKEAAQKFPKLVPERADFVDHTSRQATPDSNNWGDRMARQLAKLRKSIKTNHDDFLADTSALQASTKTKTEAVDQIEQPEPQKTTSIVEQVNAHIEAAQQESALIQERISTELERDLKYLRPETAEAIRNQPKWDATNVAPPNEPNQDNDKKIQPPLPDAVPQLRTDLELIDANNLELLPRASLPNQRSPAKNTVTAEERDEQIARFFELNEQMKRVDEARLNQLKNEAATHSSHKLELIDDSVANPFSKKTVKVTVSGPRAKAKKPIKGYRGKSTMSRIMNSLHDFQKLIPKIFN